MKRNGYSAAWFFTILVIVSLLYSCDLFKFQNDKSIPTRDNEYDPGAENYVGVNLLNPGDRSRINSKTPSFSWNEHPETSTYHLLVDDDYSFTSPVIDIDTLSSNTFTAPSELVQGITYFWKVNTINSEGAYGIWSQVYEFSIQDLLSGGIVTPQDGSNRSSFRFSIDYFDEKAAEPETAYLFINTARYIMHIEAGRASDGKYVYETSLNADTIYQYYYEFEFPDNSTLRYPNSGYLQV